MSEPKGMSLKINALPDKSDRVQIIGQSGKELMEIIASADSDEFIVSLRPGVILDGTSIAPQEVPQAKHDHVGEPAGALEIPRNWKIEDGHLVVWSTSGNNAEVELPISEPGPYTPTGVKEIFGQDQMLFETAMAIHLREPVMLTGPTGTGKTTVLEWFAMMLGYNLFKMSITPKTESAHMIGEYLPGDEAGLYPFVYGPVAMATISSQTHPTILVLDELSRIGNVAETAGILPLLDDQRRLEIPQRRNETGHAEVLLAGNLFVAATSNPADSEDDEIGVGDYLGVTELDPALASRFTFHPTVGYPSPEIETAALMDRVPALNKNVAENMVQAANRIRQAAEVRFPISFRELEGWAQAYPFLGYIRAAEIAVARKAHPSFRSTILGMLNMTKVA